jgi:hypothetical protein
MRLVPIEPAAKNTASAVSATRSSTTPSVSMRSARTTYRPCASVATPVTTCSGRTSVRPVASARAR